MRKNSVYNIAQRTMAKNPETVYYDDTHASILSKRKYTLPVSAMAPKALIMTALRTSLFTSALVFLFNEIYMKIAAADIVFAIFAPIVCIIVPWLMGNNIVKFGNDEMPTRLTVITITLMESAWARLLMLLLTNTVFESFYRGKREYVGVIEPPVFEIFSVSSLIFGGAALFLSVRCLVKMFFPRENIEMVHNCSIRERKRNLDVYKDLFCITNMITPSRADIMSAESEKKSTHAHSVKNMQNASVTPTEEFVKKVQDTSLPSSIIRRYIIEKKDKMAFAFFSNELYKRQEGFYEIVDLAEDIIRTSVNEIKEKKAFKCHQLYEKIIRNIDEENKRKEEFRKRMIETRAEIKAFEEARKQKLAAQETRTDEDPGDISRLSTNRERY